MQTKPIVIKDIMNLSIQKANEQYGEPFETDRFNIKDGLPEFRIGLYNRFDTTDDVAIFEATWKKTDSTNLTLWYTQKGDDWFPIEHFEWNKDLEF